MAQRYSHPTALERMAEGNCPECGLTPQSHLSDSRFWVPRLCDLTDYGVTNRIAQYLQDLDPSDKESCHDPEQRNDHR